MEIFKLGSMDSAKGPEDWFTGAVRIDYLFGAEEPGRVSGATVTFEPGPAPPGTFTRSGRFSLPPAASGGRSAKADR